ncbi:GAF and ANTAR domain-containing protein [Pengzhenrongella sp.]|jgi:GAF domain-containing protein|uniref:GAF and ANTAR domain-containing protein n=1 Tax=Pengzhenrongella sp. TaxID=2888820 RepID=UPI002F93935A
MFGYDWAHPSNRAARRAARELEDLFFSTEVVEDFLTEIVNSAVAVVGGDVSAAVTLSRNGRPATLAYSDARAARYDQAQYSHHAGPSLTAMRVREIVLIEDLTRGETFSEYRLRALALGVRSALSVPLDARNHCVGVLNLYSRHAYAFGPSEQSEVRRFADEVSRVLSLTLRLAHDIEITAQLRAAVASRTVIDQAIGIVMSQYQCDPDVASALLAAASRDRKVTLGAVAADITTAVSEKPPTNGHHFRV